MQGMQDNYKTMQNDIKEKLNGIKKEFESSLGGAKKVDLGEISVKSETPAKQ
jgi:hypothetical protein